MPTPTSSDRNQDGIDAELIVALRLREERVSRRIPRAEVAKQLGITQSHLSRIESGERKLRLSDAWMIAKCVGVDLRDMIP